MAVVAIVEELLKLAEKYSAPFIETALDRLKSEIFGNGRATRSTDIVIVNSTDKSFQLQENFCGTGGWTSSMLPEENIPAKSSVLCGAESYGFMTGCTNCTLKYLSTDKSASFQICTSNAYFGPVKVNGIAKGIHIETIYSRGNNNLARFILKNNWIRSAARSGGNKSLKELCLRLLHLNQNNSWGGIEYQINSLAN